MPSRRRLSYKAPKRSQPKRVLPKPEVNVPELRKQLAGFKKDVDINFGQENIQGKFSRIVKSITLLAEQNGFDLDEVEIRRIQTGRYRDQTKWVIRGKRDYTDDELKKLGPKLLEQKAKAEKRAEAQRNKDLMTIQRLASKHGLPDPTIQASSPKKVTVTLRELRFQAKLQGIKGADRMTREQLESVVVLKD